MFFLASFVNDPAERRTDVKPGAKSLLPDLLADSMENRNFFNGKVDLNWSRAPRYGVFDFHEQGPLLIMFAGYAREFGEDRFLGAADVLSLFWYQGKERFGGQYLIIVYDDSSGRVTLLNTLSRLIPAYWHASRGELVVSNRQVQLGLSAGLTEIDEQALGPFAGEGYFPHERGMFRHINLAPADARIDWAVPDLSCGSRTKQLSNTLDAVGSADPDYEDFDRISESLRRAFLPVIPEAAIRVGLSGGRDSRLIVAALKAADADFAVYTNSSTEDPSGDVEIEVAREVAAVLDVTQDIRLPRMASSSSAVGGGDLVDRLVAVARNSDCSVFGHEGVGSEPEKYDFRAIHYNGGGGELLRQAYGSKAWQDKEMAKRVILRHLHIEKAGLNLGWYRTWLKEWIADNSHLSPGALLNKFSLTYRTGRWGAGIYSSTYSRISQRPFYDNELLTAVLPLKSKWTASDILYYETLNRLSPDLLKVPFAGNREWGLSSSGIEAYQRIGDRLPVSRPSHRTVKNHAVQSGVPWRQEILGPLGDTLLKLARSASGRGSFFPENYVDALEQSRSTVEQGTGDRRLTKALWGSASTAVMVSMINERIY